MFHHFQANDCGKNPPPRGQVIVRAPRMNLEMGIGRVRQCDACIRRINAQGLDTISSEKGVDKSVPASEVEDTADLSGAKFLENWRDEIVVRGIVPGIQMHVGAAYRRRRSHRYDAIQIAGIQIGVALQV
jgi:hypothetical protein